ncbi:MAG: hypothetical protein KAS12_01785 [Candidatus Aenigmarchaeota archaeon]|nr:hypothetical protein [Candidatus Aenigmarchaeota archaeon]
MSAEIIRIGPHGQFVKVLSHSPEITKQLRMAHYRLFSGTPPHFAHNLLYNNERFPTSTKKVCAELTKHKVPWVFFKPHINLITFVMRKSNFGTIEINENYYEYDHIHNPVDAEILLFLEKIDANNKLKWQKNDTFTTYTKSGCHSVDNDAEGNFVINNIWGKIKLTRDTLDYNNAKLQLKISMQTM